ncbi:cadmium/zinc-transporting ATPase HMA3-like [Iris pallida]|uniref:Cadmium/zinc-transporting ATPase HMA3-like n=1 Tax=Iris pallida TaxID=29817 RepID=A0AAX6IL40_IRIPA|nr:cadmium/zinc-transporting ATPase HMA3-like [Iris pallida]
MEGAGKPSKTSSIQRSYFDVLGICCPSEVPLIEKILLPLDGVHKVNVVVTSRTVIVVHDTDVVTQLDIVNTLNQARLEATVRAYGADAIIKKWPNPYILACGVFLVLSLFHRFFRPLRWLALVAVSFGLYPIILRSIASVRRCNLDINILMLIAVAGAVALRDYSEAGFIVFLFTIAEWLESRASSKATAGMSALMSMAPQKAIIAGTGQVVDAREIQVNTILAVKAGEVIPIDGVVIEGRSEVNEQTLTGESFPVAKQAQSLVWAGTLNIDGYISVKTTALAEDSAVARMAKLVEEAQHNRSKTQRYIDYAAKYYTPAVVVIAAGVAVIPVILRAHNTRYWMQLALVILVSACPCALVLSTPVATFCALLTAAKTGLLVKGGDVLEALARTRIVAFDKTGTITKGEFTVLELCPIGCQVNLDTLLYWVSCIESKSSHPMASALVNHARSNFIKPKPEIVNEFEIYPGEGVCGIVDGKKIYIGNKRIATRAGCQTVPSMGSMKEGVTHGYVFLEKEPIGMFTLNDTCRTGVAEAIRELKSLGVRSIMLTGDSTAAAMHAQSQLGNVLEELQAELLPDDKVRIINNLKTKEGPTTMVGDGMNDAPALAAADVGISMGISGSAVAMETSHITLMSNDILKIPKAIRLARRTRKCIMVNIVFSVVTKVAILALSFAGHPLIWAAVLADVGTCLLVILNSMTLLRTSAPKKNDKCHRSCHASGGEKHNHANHSDGRPCCQPAHSRADACADACGSDIHKRHTQRSVNVDQCSQGACNGSPDGMGSCCQELGMNAAKASHGGIISVGCEHGDAHKANLPKSCKSSCCSPATNVEEEHVLVMECVAKGHDHIVAKESSSTCGHGNNGNKKCGITQEKEEIGGCCQTERKECAKRDCCSSSSLVNLSACCSTGATKAKDEHVVVIGCVAEHGAEANKCAARENEEIGGCCQAEGKAPGKRDAKENRECCKSEDDCRGAREEKVMGGCCQTESKECGERDCCSSSSSQAKEKNGEDDCRGAGEEREIGGRCQTESKECGKRDCCSPISPATPAEGGEITSCCESEIGGKMGRSGCCKTESRKCGSVDYCSSSAALWGAAADRREVGRCCESYLKKCQKRGACCGGVVQLPEIITE